ncbi:MAG: hypothetical protein P8189_32130 [Anaerolineae bacterium]
MWRANDRGVTYGRELQALSEPGMEQVVPVIRLYVNLHQGSAM